MKLPLKKSTIKHLLHCLLLFTSIVAIFVVSGGLRGNDFENIDPWTEYGTAWTLFLYTVRYIALLPIPFMTFNFLGLVLYNAFDDPVTLKGSPLLSPFLSIRVVTRGDYGDLVRRNVMRNMHTCLTAGLQNFLIEVVTDRPLHLPKHRRIREIVVPKNYRTKTGALYKARALQYCLEDHVNILSANDWIVHLDEETLMTVDSVKGILNFLLDGKCQFGQGLITYASGNVVNWITTLIDSFRIGDDMGKLRFQFKAFGKPIFSWKGSFVVAQYSAEKDVTFDHGFEGSIAEDCFFAMIAFSKGYKFNFIEGEMQEKSPFTILDSIKQRIRWFHGGWLAVHSRAIPIKYKLCLTMSFYCWVTMPLSTSCIYLSVLKPMPASLFIKIIWGYLGGMTMYMYIFGVMKSVPLKRYGIFKSILIFCGAILCMMASYHMENIAVIWGLISRKNKFYIVQKEINVRKGNGLKHY